MNHEETGRNASHYAEENASTHLAETTSHEEDAPTNGDAGGMEALLRENDYSFRSLRRGETIEGTVVRVDQDEVLIDIGLKSEGVIPSRELYSDEADGPTLHVGDRALVYVVQPETQDGHAVLSLRRARMERSWRDIEEIYNDGGVIEAPVVDHNKGGLIVDVKGVRGFVPVSQVLDLRNVTRQEGEGEEVSQTLAAMSGRRLPLKIIEINRSRNRLILSERAAVQEQRTQRKDHLMDTLEPGQVRRGVVSNLTSFGAFIDLGGADGLVHVSELSYNRVNHPGEILHVGQETDVFILSVDKETRKIALSLKKALPDPWTLVEEQYHVGEVVEATITKLAKFGAFAKIQEGLEGLIHLSELTDLPVQDASQVVQEGQEVQVKIIHINSQRRRLGLSVRQAAENAGYTESFGTLDTDSPFAEQALDAFADAPANVSEIPVMADTSEIVTHESEDAGDGSSLDVESNAEAGEIPGPTSEPSAEVPTTSPEIMETGDDNDEHSMATTGRQSSATE